MNAGWRGLSGAKQDETRSRDRRKPNRGVSCSRWLYECEHPARRGPWSKNGLYGNHIELHSKNC